MTQMHVPAFRVSVNPLPRPSGLARLRSLARPAEQGLLLAALLLFLAGTAQAAGSSMPWRGRCNPSSNPSRGRWRASWPSSSSSPRASALAFGDTSGGFRKLIQIVFGLSIAFAASSFFLSFFSFSGGAVECPGHLRGRLRGAAASVAHGADPAGRGTANGRHCERHAGRRRRAGPATVDSRCGALDRRPFAGGMGARVDPQFMQVFARHIKHRPLLDV